MVGQVRHGGHIGGKVENRPSRWNWDLFKDYIHFYIMIGAIPIGALIVGSNIMVGSAVLKPIPEGYNPTEDEYFKSPITRWFLKNVYRGFQQTYEMEACRYWEEQKKAEITALMREVKRVQKLSMDYKGWYTKENDGGMYMRMAMKDKKDYMDRTGY